MKEEEQLKHLVKENVFHKIRKGVNKAWDTTKSIKEQAPDVIRRETKETKKAMEILMRILKRQKVTIQERVFLKKQTVDVGKALGLLAGGVISIPLTIALVAFLEKKGIKVLPQERNGEITNEEINLMEQALNKIENEVRIPFELSLPNDLLVINQIFTKSGFELYVVGGAVRDALNKVQPKDYDLATDANPQEILAMFNAVGGYGIKEAGATFPVVHVATPDHIPNTDVGLYEIATFRRDLNSIEGNHTKPETEYSTIDQDAYRRDLTINALYYDIDSKEIIDFVGGIEDIKNGVVRTVGDPTQRFDEHRIRVMRAIRFAARVGNPLEQETADSIRKNNSLGGQPAEAIMVEFLKGIKQAKSVQDYLDMLEDFGMIPQVLPNINVNVKESFANDSDQVIVVASITRNNNPTKLHKALMAAKYSGDFAKAVSYLVDLKSLNSSNAKTKRDKRPVSFDQIAKAGILGMGDPKMIKAFIDYINLPKLGGKDAEAAGIANGTPEMGKWLAQAEAQRFTELIS
jgi:poly(A) polymerase|tara:strand:+ start:238 stop:1794 length:1557 start_codon:yes stop_codon:yes gene_type:complete